MRLLVTPTTTRSMLYGWKLCLKKTIIISDPDYRGHTTQTFVRLDDNNHLCLSLNAYICFWWVWKTPTMMKRNLICLGFRSCHFILNVNGVQPTKNQWLFIRLYWKLLLFWYEPEMYPAMANVTEIVLCWRGHLTHLSLFVGHLLFSSCPVLRSTVIILIWRDRYVPGTYTITFEWLYIPCWCWICYSLLARTSRKSLYHQFSIEQMLNK